MKNKLTDLNNHLFAHLERLSDESLPLEQLQVEIERGKAITQVSTQIIANAKLSLDAQIALGEQTVTRLPAMIGIVDGSRS